MRLRVDKLGGLAARLPRPAGAGAGARPLPGRLLGRVGYGTRNLSLAAFLGLLAVVLTLAYVHQYKRKVDQGAAQAVVFVAARDIPAGTPGSELVAGQALVARRVPQRDVVQGAISVRRQVAGLIAAEPIYAGEQLTTRRFTTAAAAGIRGDVNGAVRAMAVEGDAQQLMAGVLQRGDRVDVLMAVRYRAHGGAERIASHVVLRDLRVLSAPAAPATSAKIGGGGQAGMQAVLAVTDRQAQKLFIAMKHEWSLALRPFGRSADPPTGIDTSVSVLNGSGR
jgi:Flp pilus assembly protein CpaB